MPGQATEETPDLPEKSPVRMPGLCQKRKHRCRRSSRSNCNNARRNLGVVDPRLKKVADAEMTRPLSQRQLTLLGTIRELLVQQTSMYKSRKHQVSDRIVNLHQPHVRPIVRGKAGAAVEFEGKVSISLENGFSRIEKLSWNSYNEAGTLKETLERYKHARLKETAECVIAMRFLVMNLEDKLRVLFAQFFNGLFGGENHSLLASC